MYNAPLGRVVASKWYSRVFILLNNNESQFCFVLVFPRPIDFNNLWGQRIFPWKGNLLLWSIFRLSQHVWGPGQVQCIFFLNNLRCSVKNRNRLVNLGPIHRKNPKWVICLIWAIVGHYTDKKVSFLHIFDSFCPCSDPLWLKWVKWLIWVFLWYSLLYRSHRFSSEFVICHVVRTATLVAEGYNRALLLD